MAPQNLVGGAQDARPTPALMARTELAGGAPDQPVLRAHRQAARFGARPRTLVFRAAAMWASAVATDESRAPASGRRSGMVSRWRPGGGRRRGLLASRTPPQKAGGEHHRVEALRSRLISRRRPREPCSVKRWRWDGRGCIRGVYRRAPGDRSAASRRWDLGSGSGSGRQASRPAGRAGTGRCAAAAARIIGQSGGCTPPAAVLANLPSRPDGASAGGWWSRRVSSEVETASRRRPATRRCHAVATASAFPATTSSRRVCQRDLGGRPLDQRGEHRCDPALMSAQAGRHGDAVAERAQPREQDLRIWASRQRRCRVPWLGGDPVVSVHGLLHQHDRDVVLDGVNALQSGLGWPSAVSRTGVLHRAGRDLEQFFRYQILSPLHGRRTSELGARGSGLGSSSVGIPRIADFGCGCRSRIGTSFLSS
jgi:hypothetical protein